MCTSIVLAKSFASMYATDRWCCHVVGYTSICTARSALFMFLFALSSIINFQYKGPYRVYVFVYVFVEVWIQTQTQYTLTPVYTEFFIVQLEMPHRYTKSIYTNVVDDDNTLTNWINYNWSVRLTIFQIAIACKFMTANRQFLSTCVCVSSGGCYGCVCWLKIYCSVSCIWYDSVVGWFMKINIQLAVVVVTYTFYRAYRNIR